MMTGPAPAAPAHPVRTARLTGMFLVELAFDGNPARLALRPAHRAKLADLHASGTVRIAGPYDDQSGAALVFDVPDEATLDAVLADDPYYAADGVTIVRRVPFTPVVGGQTP